MATHKVYIFPGELRRGSTLADHMLHMNREPEMATEKNSQVLIVSGSL